MRHVDPVLQTQKVYDQIAQNYAHRNLKPNGPVLRSLETFARMLPAGARVLDVGCAEGRETEWLLAHHCIVTGCDLNETFIHMACTRCPRATFVIADMRTLPPHIGTFDGLWACASFLHIPKKDALRTLQGFHAVLEPGGILYIGVLHGDFEGMRANAKMNWPARYFSHYQQDELTTLLMRAGFEVISITESPRPKTTSFLDAFAKRIP